MFDDIETVTLRYLSLAIDQINDAIKETENGLISDHCAAAINQIQKAMTLAIGEQE